MNSGAFCSLKLSDVLSGAMPFIQVPLQRSALAKGSRSQLRAQGPHFLTKAGSYTSQLGLSQMSLPPFCFLSA